MILIARFSSGSSGLYLKFDALCIGLRYGESDLALGVEAVTASRLLSEARLLWAQLADLSRRRSDVELERGR